MQKTKSPVSADNKANKFSYLTIAKLTYIYTSHPREAGQTSFQLPESEWPTTQMGNVGGAVVVMMLAWGKTPK